MLSFAFNELNYAPEIAGSMLKRQMAQALIEARSEIVRGAVDISSFAVKELKKRGVELKEKDQERLMSDLMAVICGEQAQ